MHVHCKNCVESTLAVLRNGRHSPVLDAGEVDEVVVGPIHHGAAGDGHEGPESKAQVVHGPDLVGSNLAIASLQRQGSHVEGLEHFLGGPRLMHDNLLSRTEPHVYDDLQWSGPHALLVHLHGAESFHSASAGEIDLRQASNRFR